jgi:hypothetical protein
MAQMWIVLVFSSARNPLTLPVTEHCYGNVSTSAGYTHYVSSLRFRYSAQLMS